VTAAWDNGLRPALGSKFGLILVIRKGHNHFSIFAVVSTEPEQELCESMEHTTQFDIVDVVIANA
jgi:hypothetical protein